MLRLHNATNPAKIVMHHEDGRQTKGLYLFNAQIRMYHAWADMGLSEGLLSKRETMGGNDTYAGAIHDDETGTYSNVASARGDTNEWARLAFETMGGANGAYDSICMGMTDRDHHEKVAVIRFQISTNQEYEGLDTDACNGYGWRKRSPSPSLRPESDGIICQKEYGPSTVCCNAGGGCRVVNGECAANLDQPETACDGIWCEPQRVCA